MPSPRRDPAKSSNQYGNNNPQIGVPPAQVTDTTRAGQRATPAVALADGRFRTFPPTQPQQPRRPHPAMPPTSIVSPSCISGTLPGPAGIRKASPPSAKKAGRLSSVNVAAFQASADRLAAERAKTLARNLQIPGPSRRETAPARFENAALSATSSVTRRSTLPNAPVAGSAGERVLQGQQFVNLAQLNNRQMQSPPVSAAVVTTVPTSLRPEAASSAPAARAPAHGSGPTPGISGTLYQVLRRGDVTDARKQDMLVRVFLAKGNPSDDAISRLADGNEAIAEIVRIAANTAVLRRSEEWAQ